MLAKKAMLLTDAFIEHFLSLVRSGDLQMLKAMTLLSSQPSSLLIYRGSNDRARLDKEILPPSLIG